MGEFASEIEKGKKEIERACGNSKREREKVCVREREMEMEKMMGSQSVRESG